MKTSFFPQRIVGLALLVFATIAIFHFGKRLLTRQPAWEQAAPFLALASPTAVPEPKHIEDNGDWSRVSAAFDVPILGWFVKMFSSKGNTEDNAAGSLPLSELIDRTKQLWEKSPYEIAQAIDFESTPAAAPRCFGAALEFNGQSIPAGKLGLLSPTEPPVRGAQACAAAQMNHLVSLAGAANAALKTVMLLAATAKHEGELLVQDAATDITAKLPRIGKNIEITKGTLSSVSLAPYPTYLTKVEISQSGQSGYLLNYHTPLNEKNTSYRGMVKGVFPYPGKSGEPVRLRAMAMTYQSDGKTLNYLLEMAANREKMSGEFFKDNRIHFKSEAFGEEGYRYLASFDPKTNEGSMKVAWMDDARDTASRIFEVKVGNIGEGLLGGYAYFGFGSPLAELDENKKFWISKFYPGWPMGTPIEGKCQGQKFTQHQVGGPFLSTEFHGPFVPTQTGTGSGVFSGNYDYNGATTVHSLDLVAPGEYGEVSVPVPEFRLPASSAGQNSPSSST